jgi:succinate dehydrogenase/fumarate reductase cytochrome b subunit
MVCVRTKGGREETGLYRRISDYLGALIRTCLLIIWLLHSGVARRLLINKFAIGFNEKDALELCTIVVSVRGSLARLAATSHP